MGTCRYTNWICSQSLTVVEHTISDLPALKRLFSIHVIQSPPHLSGSYMSYVSLLDVRKTWEHTATLNGHICDTPDARIEHVRA